MPTANEQLADDFVSHRLFLLRYEAGTVAAMLQAYQDALGDITLRLTRQLKRLEASPGDPLTRTEVARLVALRTEITAEVKALEPVLADLLQGRLVEVAEVEAAVVRSRLLGAVAPEVRVAVVGLPTAQVAAAVMQPIGGKIWHDRLAADLLEVHDQLQRSVASSIAAGDSVPRAAKAIKDGVGVVETYKGRMVSIARTEIQRVANTTALATYQANADVVGGVVYLATLDSRTCLVCAPLHNQSFDYDAGGMLPSDAPAVPQHPRCRCFYAPRTRSWRDIGVDIDDPGQRRRMDGERPENMRFDQWLRRQPDSVGLDILGATRWAAWKQGSLGLASFSDQGRILNLGELAARYPEAGL